MQILEVEYKKNNHNNAEYINIDNILDSSKNYIIQIDGRNEAIYINDFFSDKKMLY